MRGEGEGVGVGVGEPGGISGAALSMRVEGVTCPTMSSPLARSRSLTRRMPALQPAATAISSAVCTYACMECM